MSSPLEKPVGLSWDAASVELPPVPMLPPGPDAMSTTISAVLPTLTTPLTASVAALSAKENMFSGKLGAAQSAYQNADDQGQQSMGQLSMLSQMARQAGGPAQALGGQSGTFGSMMEQAMRAAKGGGSQGGAPIGGGPASAGPAGTGAAAPHPRAEAAAPGREPALERHDETRRERPPVEAAGPGDGGRHTAGPPPVAPPEHPRRDGEDDLARRM